jgi:type 1 fimbria pilin
MKFSNTLLALAIASSAALAPSAFAQSADLSINGRIFPGACVVDLGNGGVAELGSIRLESLQADMTTVLDDVDLNMNIACQSAVRFALEGVDNSHDSSISPSQYGLGVTAADEKIGSARLGFVDVTADGEAAQSMTSDDGGDTWVVNLFPETATIGKGSMLGFRVGTGGQGPMPIKDLQGTVKVRATIAPTSELTVTEDVPVQGNATINLTYL